MAGFRALKADGRTQLHYMASKGDLYKLRTMLQPSDLTIPDKRNVTVLHELARRGDLFIAKLKHLFLI